RPSSHEEGSPPQEAGPASQEGPRPQETGPASTARQGAGAAAGPTRAPGRGFPSGGPAAAGRSDGGARPAHSIDPPPDGNGRPRGPVPTVPGASERVRLEPPRTTRSRLPAAAALRAWRGRRAPD